MISVSSDKLRIQINKLFATKKVFHWAALGGFTDICSLLLQKSPNMDINTKDDRFVVQNRFGSSVSFNRKQQWLDATHERI